MAPHITIGRDNRITTHSVTDYCLLLGVGGTFVINKEPDRGTEKSLRRKRLDAVCYLFSNGATHYLNVPINGLRVDYSYPNLPLLDRVLLAPPFIGDHDRLER